ncbi:MAG: endonuclease III, partial [Pseudomonadota bacterium]
ITMSRQLVDNFGGQVPQTREELVTLAGVGRKTANVVLNEVCGQPTIAVDTHIFRVGNRTGMAIGKTPDEVEAGLEAVIPAQYKLGAHHWLILHGRYICVARKPKCNMCSIVALCKFDGKVGGSL